MRREQLLAEGWRPIAVHPAPQTGGPRLSVRGRVRVESPITSPVGRRPCAVWRLLGDAPTGPIDDAGGTSFEVVTSTGSVWVELGHAAVDLRVPPAVPVRVGKTLAELLRERGCLTVPDRLTLSEAVLAEGDEVVVEGVADATPDAAYRSRYGRIFRDMAGAPLVIRGA